MPFFLLNTSDKNLEIAILLRIAQRSYNKNSVVDTTPRALGQAF